MTGGDYSKAIWLPSSNYWIGGDGNQLIVVHATASNGPQTGYQLATSTEFTDGKSKSVHYIVDIDGKVYQIVREADSAWGNDRATGASPYDHNYNWNKKTISIENVKHSSDNSEPLTIAQYQSLLSLIRDICQRQKIPLQAGTPFAKGIIFHHDLDPVNKARCPGTFPYNTFLQDLGGLPVTTTTKVQTNKDNCVCDVVRTNQLFENEMRLCGPWSIVMMKFAGPPNTGPTGTVESIDNLVDMEVKALGYTNPADFPGVSIPDMETIFHDLNLHYWETSPDWGTIRKAVQAGYPVIITGKESTIFRWASTGWVPAYSWGPTSPDNHVFPIAGFDQNGNPICYDQLSQVADTEWPPIYDASRLMPSYAAIVQIMSTATIPNGDPNTWPTNFNAQTGVMPMPDLKRQAFNAEWTAVIPTVSTTSGLANFAYSLYWTPNFPGPALSPEFQRIDTDGKLYTMQIVAQGLLKWDGLQAHYYPYKSG